MSSETKKKDIHSPYVVVLGGERVHRKPAPTQLTAREKPEQHVFGVLPPIKTMEHDLEEASKHASIKPAKLSIFKTLFSKQKTLPPGETTSSKPERILPRPVARARERTTVVHPVAPTEPRVQRSEYAKHFERGIEKKGYLKSKLAIQLPRRAKIGAGLALLALLVAVPVFSLFSEKTPPPTAGTIVAQGTEALLAQVGKSIELPLGEVPLVVVATADDIRRLNVPDARPGNKILLYQEAGKIVVYDADLDKVLGVVNRARP